jgi:hypothetical protein
MGTRYRIRIRARSSHNDPVYSWRRVEALVGPPLRQPEMHGTSLRPVPHWRPAPGRAQNVYREAASTKPIFHASRQVWFFASEPQVRRSRAGQTHPSRTTKAPSARVAPWVAIVPLSGCLTKIERRPFSRTEGRPSDSTRRPDHSRHQSPSQPAIMLRCISEVPE